MSCRIVRNPSDVVVTLEDTLDAAEHYIKQLSDPNADHAVTAEKLRLVLVFGIRWAIDGTQGITVGSGQ